MRRLFLTAAAGTIATAAFMTLSPTPASAGAFCATYPDGQGMRSCGYMTYAQCARTIRGAGGQCVTNTGQGYGYNSYGGFEDSYAYAPEPVYGPRYYGGPGYYGGPRVGISIGAY
jgi:hypothetical protein